MYSQRGGRRYMYLLNDGWRNPVYFTLLLAELVALYGHGGLCYTGETQPIMA